MKNEVSMACNLDNSCSLGSFYLEAQRHHLFATRSYETRSTDLPSKEVAKTNQFYHLYYATIVNNQDKLSGFKGLYPAILGSKIPYSVTNINGKLCIKVEEDIPDDAFLGFLPGQQRISCTRAYSLNPVITISVAFDKEDSPFSYLLITQKAHSKANVAFEAFYVQFKNRAPSLQCAVISIAPIKKGSILICHDNCFVPNMLGQFEIDFFSTKFTRKALLNESCVKAPILEKRKLDEEELVSSKKAKKE